MFSISVISAPSHLPTREVAALCRHWGGGAVVWLAEDEAAQFSTPTHPSDFWQVWAEFQQKSIDLTLQSAPPSPKALLVADMDSTMIKEECLDALAARLGVGEEVRHITTRAMNGEMDFAEALRARVALLRGGSVEVLTEVIDNLHFTAGARVLLATMKARGGYAVLVSGGFTPFTEFVAAALGFDAHHANRLLSHEGMLTGKVAEPIQGADAKAQLLENLMKTRGLGAEAVLAVGDGANDGAMVARAGLGVAFRAKSALADICDVRINHGDLTALLYLQGYTKEDFVWDA